MRCQITKAIRALHRMALFGTAEGSVPSAQKQCNIEQPVCWARHFGATTIDPKLLTAAERLQYEGYLRREETNVAILTLSKSGTPIKHIVRQTGYSRKLVRQAIRGERHDVFRTRQSSLDQHLPWLDDQWASGCRNGAELWRRLKARGFRGSLRVISEWASRRRRAERVDAQNLQRIPSARKIARLMTIGRDLLTKRRPS